MSLLLDALRVPESNVEPDPESAQEPLDERATLELLISNPAAQRPKDSDRAVAEFEAAASLVDAPPSPVGQSPVAPSIAIIPVAAPPQSTVSGRDRPAVSATVRAASMPPAVSSPPRKYSLIIGAIGTLVAVAMLGRYLWQANTNHVIYPEGGETPAAAPSIVQASPPASKDAVQVLSQRPSDQFANTREGPEIAPVGPANAAVPSPAARSGARLVHAADPATLSVTRSVGPSSIDRHVQAGYQALISGNVANANLEYFAALELDSNNIDALMGTAAVAAQEDKRAIAIAAYTKVLKLEPGNPDATAAIAMLSGASATREANESHLKTLIAGEEGGRPSLHTALAGEYASEGRWTEAAQEYFTALGKDPGNPDLAFNVAASLDQNRNAAMALNFYQQAVEFARQRPAQMNVQAVEQRISQLKTQLEVRAATSPGAP
jgi:Flp pilus assembly protein TadD